jgi:hypothetical protein
VRRLLLEKYVKSHLEGDDSGRWRADNGPVTNTDHKGASLMFNPIAAHHVRHATEAMAQSARPEAPIRPASATAARRWMRRARALRLPLAARRSAARPAPALK